MAYSSPKAADFTAYCDGEPMAWNVPIGLRARWHVASEVEKVVPNLFLPSERDRELVDAICRKMNDGSRITVKLDRRLACDA